MNAAKSLIGNGIGILAGMVLLLILISVSHSRSLNILWFGPIAGVVSIFFGVYVNLFFGKIFNINETTDV